jgi:hypothetical protein
VAEVQVTLAEWMNRMEPGAPILMAQPRYSRIMAHVGTPSPFVTTTLCPPLVKVEPNGMDWSIEFPYTQVAAWTQSLVALSQVTSRAHVSFSPLKSIESKSVAARKQLAASMIPFRAIEMVAH